MGRVASTGSDFGIRKNEANQGEVISLHVLDGSSRIASFQFAQPRRVSTISRGEVRRAQTQFSFSFSEGVPSGRLRSRFVEVDRQCGPESVNFRSRRPHAHRIRKPDGWPLPRDIGSRRLVADRYPGLLECFRVIAVTGGPTSESPCSFVIRITCVREK